MAKQILLAGILGGLALFMWGGAAHMALGLGTVGIQTVPQQQVVMDTLKTAVPQSGFYFFPEADKSGKVAADRVGGPYGIMIYHASGAGGAMTGQLVNEVILNIVMALFAAYLLSKASQLRGYISRVGFVTLIGIMVGAMTHVQYWNWFGFPLNYTVSYIFIDLIGFLIVGLIAAAFVKATPAATMMMPSRAA
jgi:hypothetical protein